MTKISFKNGNIPDSEFDSKELKRGIEKEKEHTDVAEIAKQIVKAHLKEHPDYYKVLDKAERMMK